MLSSLAHARRQMLGSGKLRSGLNPNSFSSCFLPCSPSWVEAPSHCKAALAPQEARSHI